MSTSLSLRCALLQSNIIKHVGWRSGALATPLVMGLLAAPFFWLIIMSRGSAVSAETLSLIVTFGAAQGLLAKSSKNAFFDPTTQMCWIPLDEVGDSSSPPHGKNMHKASRNHRFTDSWLLNLGVEDKRQGSYRRAWVPLREIRMCTLATDARFCLRVNQRRITSRGDDFLCCT